MPQAVPVIVIAVSYAAKYFLTSTLIAALVTVAAAPVGPVFKRTIEDNENDRRSD